MSFEGTWLIKEYFRLTMAPALFAVDQTKLQITADGSGGYTVVLTGLPLVLGCEPVEVTAQQEGDALQSETFRLPCSLLPALDVNFRMAEPMGAQSGGLLNAALAAGGDERFIEDEEPVATWTAEEEGGAVEG